MQVKDYTVQPTLGFPRFSSRVMYWLVPLQACIAQAGLTAVFLTSCCSHQSAEDEETRHQGSDSD